jgi:hypothetical protein
MEPFAFDLAGVEDHEAIQARDEEVTAPESGAAYLEAAGRDIPVLLDDIQRAIWSEGPDPVDQLLDRISARVLVLRKSGARPYFTAAARHVGDHV